MAKNKEMKKKIEKKTHAGTGFLCEDCARGLWNTENVDWQNRYFFGYCEHATFATRPDGRRVFLANCEACENFIRGQKENAKGGMV